jgi:hypothetical protein
MASRTTTETAGQVLAVAILAFPRQLPPTTDRTPGLPSTSVAGSGPYDANASSNPPNPFTDFVISGGEPSTTIYVRNLSWSTSNEPVKQNERATALPSARNEVGGITGEHPFHPPQMMATNRKTYSTRLSLRKYNQKQMTSFWLEFRESFSSRTRLSMKSRTCEILKVFLSI